MSRLLLVHWNRKEGEEKARKLEASGRNVRLHFDPEIQVHSLRKPPPDVVVISLERLPSHGMAVGTWMRQQKTMRGVPLVFVEGVPEKTARAKKQLPDAVFTPWSRVRGSVTRALKNPPVNPVVPGTMAAYSGTPLPKKLGLKGGQRVGLLGAPVGFERALEPLPEDVVLRRQARGIFENIVVFSKTRKELESRFPTVTEKLVEGGRIWLLWPKKGSALGDRTDLKQAEIRALGLENGFVDFKICAVDDTWSGLCFSRRRKRG